MVTAQYRARFRASIPSRKRERPVVARVYANAIPSRERANGAVAPLNLYRFPAFAARAACSPASFPNNSVKTVLPM
jgi:hypothetical protein